MIPEYASFPLFATTFTTAGTIVKWLTHMLLLFPLEEKNKRLRLEQKSDFARKYILREESEPSCRTKRLV